MNKQNLPDRVEKTITENRLISAGDHVLLALSGGADSVCLFHLFRLLSSRLSFAFSAAHVNHGLRGEEADRDEDFVLSLCAQYQIPCFHEKFDVKAIAKVQKKSIEDAGRFVRYQYFDQLCKENHFTQIATAHHADDNVETVLMNFLRGASVGGLSGMAYRNDRGVIHPLLDVSRSEIRSFLSEKGFRFTEDSSNHSDDVTRNKIRLHLLPQLLSYNSGFSQTLLKNVRLYRETNEFLEHCAEQRFSEIVRRKKNYLKIPLAEFWREADILRHLILQRAILAVDGGAFADAEKLFLLEEAIAKETKEISVSKTCKIFVAYQFLYVVNCDAFQKSSECYPLSDCPIHLSTTGAVLGFENAGSCVSSLALSRKWLDGHKLLFRFRRDGDFFFPVGFGHKKSLQDFFTDQKVPRFLRDRIPLLVIDDEIAWVCGMRADARFVPKSEEQDRVTLYYTEESSDA